MEKNEGPRIPENMLTNANTIRRLKPLYYGEILWPIIITLYLCPGERINGTSQVFLCLFRSIILSCRDLMKPCRPTYIMLDNYKCIISGF